MAATLDGVVDGTGGGVRGQVHAAVVVLGRSGGGREAHGPAPAQYVGHQFQGGGALDHHRRRQMGRNHHVRPIASTSTFCSRPRRSSGGASKAASSPRLFGVEPPRAADRGGADRRHERVEFLGGVCGLVPEHPRQAFLDHEKVQGSSSKGLMPEDAKEAIGHGVRAKRSKSGAVSFDALDTEAARASIQ